MLTAPTQRSARIIEIQELTVPESLNQIESNLAARRFLTLLTIDASENQQGGTGRITKVFNCYGEALCLKSIAPILRVRISPNERRRLFQARTTAFHDEYLCQALFRTIPGIPTAYGYGTYQGGPIMLMEWMQGVSARSLRNHGEIAGSHLSALACASLGVSVLNILISARKIDPLFAHRDISGRNIHIRTDHVSLRQQLRQSLFDICLIDFGSSVCSTIHENRGDSQLWRNATPEYAPPEMLTHSDPVLVHQREAQEIDVYALCSVLYELYSGHTPYCIGRVRGTPAYLYKMKNTAQLLVPTNPRDRPFIDILMNGLDQHQKKRPSVLGLHKELHSFICSQNEFIAKKLECSDAFVS